MYNNNNIKCLFKDITNAVFKREYSINIILPSQFYARIDAGILTAYKIADVELP